MSRGDDARLLDIVLAGRKVAGFISGVPRDKFTDDQMRVSATIREISVVGEAAMNVSAIFREAHAGIPWKVLRGMRDVLVHAYHRTDFDVVIKTAYYALPRIVAALEPLLPKEID